MDFIDEQYVMGTEIGQDRSKIALFFHCRARGGMNLNPQLPCQDVGKRRLSQPRRAVDKDVIQGLSPALRRIDEDPEFLFEGGLSDEFIEKRRPEIRFDEVFLAACGADGAVLCVVWHGRQVDRV
jgi:hypothetical protein